MKNVLYFLFALALCACSSDQPVKTAKPGMQLPAPKRVKVESGKAIFVDDDGNPIGNKAVKNDLNGDGEEDHLEIVITNEENDGLGFKRQLVVYSGEGADLSAWYTADDVILSTEHGGTMGDPLEGIEIKDGTIVIKHFGGSRTKWAYVHRFRWQEDDFQLINTTIETDDPCKEYTKLEYNLSTSKANYATTSKDCNGDKEFELDTVSVDFNPSVFLPSMDGFKPGENELKGEGTSKALFF